MPITDRAGMKTRSEVSSLIPCSLLHSQDYTSDLGKNTNIKIVFQDCPKSRIIFQAARSTEGCKCPLKSFVLFFVVSLFSCALVTAKMECHKPTVVFQYVVNPMWCWTSGKWHWHPALKSPSTIHCLFVGFARLSYSQNIFGSVSPDIFSNIEWIKFNWMWCWTSGHWHQHYLPLKPLLSHNICKIVWFKTSACLKNLTAILPCSAGWPLRILTCTYQNSTLFYSLGDLESILGWSELKSAPKWLQIQNLPRY